MKRVYIATFVIWFMVLLWSAGVLQKSYYFFRLLPIYFAGAAASFIIINDMKSRKK